MFTVKNDIKKVQKRTALFFKNKQCHTTHIHTHQIASFQKTKTYPYTCMYMYISDESHEYNTKWRKQTQTPFIVLSIRSMRVVVTNRPFGSIKWLKLKQGLRQHKNL